MSTSTQPNNNIIKKVLNKIPEFVLGGLLIVVALAWSDAIKHFLDVNIPVDKQNAWAKLSYAAGLSIAVIIIIFILSKITTNPTIKSQLI